MLGFLKSFQGRKKGNRSGKGMKYGLGRRENTFHWGLPPTPESPSLPPTPGKKAQNLGEGVICNANPALFPNPFPCTPPKGLQMKSKATFLAEMPPPIADSQGQP